MKIFGFRRDMQSWGPYIRGRSYLQRHGGKATIARAFAEIKRGLFHNRDVIFELDLKVVKWPNGSLPDGMVVEKLVKRSDVNKATIRCFGEHRPMEFMDSDLRRRFSRGASLWLLKHDDQLIGYIWSVVGRTLKPYYLPLTGKDVHLFDNFILPAYRGRRNNAILLNEVTLQLKNEGVDRAYIETAEWNHAELKSLNRIGFVRIGLARKRFRRGKTVVTWWQEETLMAPGRCGIYGE